MDIISLCIIAHSHAYVIITAQQSAEKKAE